MKKNILLFAMLLTTAMTNAQEQVSIITSEITVSGVCSMCEERIEKAVDVKGVKYADYDLDTHTLSITYATKHLKEEQIHALLNQAGHDTEKSMASDEQYSTIHSCCKYREHEDH